MLANMGRAEIAPFEKSRYVLKAFGIKETSKEAGYEVVEADVNVISYEAQVGKRLMPTLRAVALNAMLLPPLLEW